MMFWVLVVGLPTFTLLLIVLAVRLAAAAQKPMPAAPAKMPQDLAEPTSTDYHQLRYSDVIRGHV